jgi:hypothetical protein
LAIPILMIWRHPPAGAWRVFAGQVKNTTSQRVCANLVLNFLRRMSRVTVTCLNYLVAGHNRDVTFVTFPRASLLNLLTQIRFPQHHSELAPSPLIQQVTC